ncbi:MAG: FecR domain-containing protein [Betaproteobacteria bacterium]|nr:FecR domain-containing protein [Betaproteobacteria bacterium]
MSIRELARRWRAGAAVCGASVVLAALPASPALAQRTPSEAADEWIYLVERGDTLIGLHERLLRPEADWRIVQRLNRIANPNLLLPGASLRIPVALLREEAEQAEVLHVHGEVWIERNGAARQPLSGNTPVAVGDVVTTGAQSSVSLRFADSSRTQIGPNSRLVVDRHARLGASGVVDTRLKLDAGGAEVQVPAPPPATAAPRTEARGAARPPASAAAAPPMPPARPAPRFELRTPVVNLGVRGTEFRGRVDGARVLAEVVQGRVAAGPQTVDAGFGTVATAAGVAPPRRLLPAPDAAALPERIERVPLQLNLPRVEGARAMRAQVYALGDAQGGAGSAPRLLLDGVFDQPQAAWTDDLPDGRYELRLRASDADGVEGLAAQRVFTLKARPEPPFLQRPRAGEKTTDEQVTLTWARNPQAARYKVQVAREADFAAPSVQRDDVTATELRVPLALGTHHWRVAAVRADGDTGPWGDARVVERVAVPPPPPPPSAPGGQKAAAGEDGLVVSWAASPVPGASYQVQVARDAAFTQLVLDERTTRTEALVPKADAGTYYVRVRTIGPDGRPGTFGGAQEIEVPRSWPWWPWLLPLLLLF